MYHTIIRHVSPEHVFHLVENAQGWQASLYPRPGRMFLRAEPAVVREFLARVSEAGFDIIPGVGRPPHHVRFGLMRWWAQVAPRSRKRWPAHK